MAESLLHNLDDSFYITISILGLFILIFGLVSLFVKERLYLTESLVAIIVGIIFGPQCSGQVTPLEWYDEELFHRVLLEFSRIIISFQVIAVGLSVPFDYLKKQWRSILVLLGPTMCVMWGISALAVKYVLGLDWETSLMIGACLAPTDPVLAHSVIKGKFANRYIPSHIRNLLSVESGANDGLGFPFLMLPIYLVVDYHTTIYHWFVITWCYEILLSILIGLVLGVGARFLLVKSEQYRLIDKESFLVYTIALALSITGLVALISSDDLLAVFIAGNAFAYDGKFAQATKDAHFQEVLDMLFNISFFIFLGSTFPWEAYINMGAGYLVLVATLILLFRRLPFVMLMKPFIPQLRTKREAFFAGWFGPMGVGAIFFSMVVYHHPGIPHLVKSNVFTVVSFNVLASIIIHGITVPIVHISLKTRAKRKLIKEQRKNKHLLDMELGISNGDISLMEGSALTPNAGLNPIQTDTSLGLYSTYTSASSQDKNEFSESDNNAGDEYDDTIDERGISKSRFQEKLERMTMAMPKYTVSTLDERTLNSPPPTSLGRVDTYDSRSSMDFSPSKQNSNGTL